MVKFASLNEGRDGALLVVSTDMTRCMRAGMTMQHALDGWDAHKPALDALYAKVNAGEGEPFDEAACASPLPRAYQWADGSAYVNHVQLVRKARGAEVPESFWTDPLMCARHTSRTPHPSLVAFHVRNVGHGESAARCAARFEPC